MSVLLFICCLCLKFECSNVINVLCAMCDVLEISSDSDDTIILGVGEDLYEANELNSATTVLSSINKYTVDKYSSINVQEFNSTKEDDLYVPAVKKIKKSNENLLHKSLSKSSSSSQDEGTNEMDILQALSEKYKQDNKRLEFKDKSSSDNTYVNQKRNEEDLLQMLTEKYKLENSRDNNVIIPAGKSIGKQEKEFLKQQKIEERARRKREAECEKALKQALLTANKNVKPTECLKFISVAIDDELVNESYGSDVITALQSMDIKYNVQSQIFPNTITWTRKVQSHLISDNGNLTSSSEEQDTQHILLVMNCKELVEHVDRSTLIAHIKSLKSVLDNKKITLAVYGLQSYNKYQKNREYNEMRTEVTGENQRQTTNDALFKTFPKITKRRMEFALTELELLCSCSHRLIESGQELGQLVAQFTKAVAEIQFKLQRHEKYMQTEWFVEGDNRDCVKVDKSGNGLTRLWTQALTSFPLARLETAEAITSKYPNVSSLVKAYDECSSAKEAELLLQDISVRRAAGPLSATRKIGPELSKKLYTFFTSLDGNTFL